MVGARAGLFRDQVWDDDIVSVDEYSLESEDSSTEEEEAEDAIVNNDNCTQQPRTRGRKNNGSAQNQDRIWTEKLRWFENWTGFLKFIISTWFVCIDSKWD